MYRLHELVDNLQRCFNNLIVKGFYPVWQVASVNISFHDESVEKPMYIRLYEDLREGILTGRFRSGDCLPPTRELANALNISRETAVRAYEELRVQGYIEASTGRGTFVRAVAIPQSVTNTTNLTNRCVSTSNYVKWLAKQDCFEKEITAIEIGKCPKQLLPVKQWRRMFDECSVELAQSDFAADSLGCFGLREALACFLRRTKQIACKPENVVIFPSRRVLLDTFSKILVKAGDLVVCESLSSLQAKLSFELHGGSLIGMQVDFPQLTVNTLTGLEQPSLIYLSSPAISPQECQPLLDWAAQRSILVLEDAHQQFHRSPAISTCMKSVDFHDVVSYLIDFGAALSPLTTIAAAVVPTLLTEHFRRSEQYAVGHASIMEQFLLQKFIQCGKLDRHLNQLHSIYRLHSRMLISCFKQTLKESVEIATPNSSAYLLIRLRGARSSRSPLDCAVAAGLTLVPTSELYVDNSPLQEFAIPIFELSTTELSCALERFVSMTSQSQGTVLTAQCPEKNMMVLSEAI